MDPEIGISIIRVTTRAERRRFLEVPFRVHAHDPAWVPQLFIERLDHISKKNPYFEHAEAELFLAVRGGEPVGRISAQIDRLYLDRYADATGHFGFLDAVDDSGVFAALFNAAEEWLRARGIRRIRGPFSFSINDEAGLLIKGFEKPPCMMMGHAQPYYLTATQSLGYVKAKDLLAFEFDVDQDMPEKMTMAVNKAKASGDLVLRPLSKKNFSRDLALIVDIFNDAWCNNWGFVPMTKAEIEKLGSVLRFLVEDEYIVIAEYKGESAAMLVSLPDINRWIADLNGSLFPFSWLKLIWRIMATKPAGLRIPLMGVRTKHRQKGLGGILAIAVIDAIHRYHRGRGAKVCELSWILEDNVPMRKIIDSFGARNYKTYRIIEKHLS